MQNAPARVIISIKFDAVQLSHRQSGVKVKSTLQA